MDEKHIYTLLCIVKDNGDIKRLTRIGVSFQAIAELTKNAIENELLKYESENISITEKGATLIKSLEKKFKQTDKNNWIEPKNDSKIPSFDKDFIFLPKQDELHF